MAVYLSPGVFAREITLPGLTVNTSPTRAAFVGTAKKGPLNQAVLISSPQQAIEIFGEPFLDSYMMYAVLEYMQENNSCYIMRVGVEYEEGQDDALANISVDMSGAKTKGWGRIPLFTGIDYGRINLRLIDVDNPITFHAASTDNLSYNDADLSDTNGASVATLVISGTYTGAIDDSYIMVITSAPSLSSASLIDGAGYQVIRNSDGVVVAEGNLVDTDDNGVSDFISIGDGLSIRVVVTSGVLDVNDTFSFQAHPDNRSFGVSVNGVTATTYTMPSATYTTVSSFVDAVNVLVAGDDYLLVEYLLDDGTTIPQIRSSTAGDRVQLTVGASWALELGTEQYAWDIPRSYLLGLNNGPFNISSQNNRVKVQLVGSTSTETVEFNVPIGTAQTVANIVDSVDLAGVVAGDTLWDSFELTIPGGTTHVVMVASDTHMTDTLVMMSSYSNIRTLRFAEEIGISYPYKRAYRGFSDNRLVLPDSSESDSAVPLSCDTDPASDECASDTAYFQNIVGWLVAPSPGTWVDGYQVSLEVYTEGVGDSAGRYKLTIKDASNVVLESVDDVSFDKTATRYIGNLINPGSRYGGVNGNQYINWEERPAFLDNDASLDTYDVRLPSQFYNTEFNGQANGIPDDPLYSSELDSAVIGNPSLSSGLYAFQNPESIDINILITPGFSTGAVIGTALQICESRGDMIYIIDPPFGLRPQQVVDWHNGMLLSDLQSAINSSYGALYWGWIKIYDQFSSEYVWIPPSGSVAAIYGRTARDSEQWFAPAGLRRGRMLTSLDVEYSPSQGERDLLYGSGNAVNPIVKFPQDGIVVFGQRTLMRSDSVLDRVDVRMLIISLKKALSRSLRNFVFEPNDPALWKQVISTLDPYMADIQARRGVQAYKVVCDSTINTPERIARHELHTAVIFVPLESVEFVVLDLVAMRSAAGFSTEQVLAAAGLTALATST